MKRGEDLHRRTVAAFEGIAYEDVPFRAAEVGEDSELFTIEWDNGVGD